MTLFNPSGNYCNSHVTWMPINQDNPIVPDTLTTETSYFMSYNFDSVVFFFKKYNVHHIM